MKFNKSSQLLLVSAASLLAASLVTACGTLTTDFVFVTSSKAAGPNNYGQIDVFEINKQSGYMRQIPTSPFPSGGRNPVAEALSTDNTNLYVVNQDDNTIVQFVIGNDGKVYPQNTTNTPGIFPLAVAVNGTNLFVLDTFQPLPICSPADPCSGSIAAFPITVGSGSPPSDSLGSPAANGNLNYWPLCQYGYISATDFTQCKAGATSDIIAPTGINVLASGSYVYVTAYDASVTPNVGYVFAFSAGSGGALTPLNGGVPFSAGTSPSAIASDPTGAYVYVTDATSGNILGYSVASGLLTPLTTGVNGSNKFPAGDRPSAIVADPKYPYLYVANSLDSTVTAYSVNSGTLTSLGTYSTGLQPVAIGIDPSTNHFLFTANFLGNGTNGSISGFELSATAGTLLNSQDSPFNSNAQPTAVAAIPHQATQ
ncbi:MAG TPA: beta-propeller fold lactonase family protein [Terracidiphilus sp.]|nr:beta-propeller fold lactonase family protein [Terracidiphilus sp.]